MKKLLALMLAASLALSLVACGGGGTADTNTPSGGSGDATPPTLTGQEEAKNDTYKSVECDEVVLHQNAGDLKMKMLGYEIVEYEGKINFYIRLNIANETNQTFETMAHGFGPRGWQLFQDGVEANLVGGAAPPDELVTYPENEPSIKAGGKTDQVVVCWMLNDIDYDAEFEFDYDENTIATFFISEAGEKAASSRSKPDEEKTANADVLTPNFAIDGVYYSETGFPDPSDMGITVERFFEVNPGEKEEALDSNSKIWIFVFASLHSLKEGEGDTALPASVYQSSGPYYELPLYMMIANEDGIAVDGIHLSAYEANELNNKRLSKWWGSAYKSGRDLDDDYVLYEGEEDTIKIAGLFQVKYHDYKKAIEENQELWLRYGDYVTKFDCSNIIKKDDLSSIAQDLRDKELL